MMAKGYDWEALSETEKIKIQRDHELAKISGYVTRNFSMLRRVHIDGLVALGYNRESDEVVSIGTGTDREYLQATINSRFPDGTHLVVDLKTMYQESQRAGAQTAA